MTNAPISTPAGWYQAPDGSPAMWWWDGSRWIQPQPGSGATNAANNAIAKLAVAIQILLIVYGVVLVTTLGIETLGIIAATNFLGGSDRAIDGLDVYDRSTSIVSVLSSLTVIATAILWAVWQYRVASQVAGLTRRSAGWHAGSWFVPVVNLWFPFQNISDLWRAVGRTQPRWLIVWWLLWIVSNMMVQQSTRVYLAAQDLEQFRVAMWMSAVGASLALAAVPLAVLIVRGITSGILQRPIVPVIPPPA